MIGAAVGAALGIGTPAHAQLKPYYGNVTPFYGTIDPFYGTLNPFYGTISPFYGNIDPFWGTINPFYGTISPFYGNMASFSATSDPFWGDTTRFTGTNAPVYSSVGTYWRNFGGFWQATQPLWTDPLQATALKLKLDEMIATTESLWGLSLRTQTGRSFRDGVGRELFARHGIDPANAATLQRLTSEQRARFMLDWYDTLMKYSGRDHIDHWMATVNWSPAITEQQGSGSGSIIGIIDGRLSGDPDLVDNIIWQGGKPSAVNGHGVGVASLLVGSHDGRGVMGIAPNARIATYNPFDDVNEASWKRLSEGVVELATRGASVINMSLGVAGYALHPDWRSLFFAPTVADATRGRTVFVIAAGNTGVSQTTNLAWDWSRDPAFIVVGSVDINGNISSFSNRPGTACLTSGVFCQELLANRFIVAPGELILMSDGAGGLVRNSGTSFSAPLVSGAITLLHDRWQWLARYPQETVSIILGSARDLGVPGTDPVYGRGLLDVAASQSPLDFNKLTFYEVKNGVSTPLSATQVRSGGVKSTWEADGVYFSMFETIGATYRDFIVPMSSRLVGAVTTSNGGQEQFQRFISSRMIDWIKGTSGGFTDVAVSPMVAPGDWNFAFSAANPAQSLQPSQELTTHFGFRMTDPTGRFAFNIGHGEGAMAITQQAGFGLTSDYSSSGGVNPLVSFASGGEFVGTDIAVSNRTTISFGLAGHSLAPTRNLALSQSEREQLRGFDAYEASAANLRITQRVSDSLSLSLAYARLREANGLLGVQSSVESDLRDGATSETATLGASLGLPHGLTLAASATAGRTRAENGDQNLRTSGDGVLTSAFAIAATKTGVIGKSDMLRLSVAQPLHIESGKLAYRSVEVVDRATGEIGIVERSFDISNSDRRFTGEVLYASPVLDGAGEVSLFGRMNLRSGEKVGVEEFVVGGRLSLGF